MTLAQHLKEFEAINAAIYRAMLNYEEHLPRELYVYVKHQLANLDAQVDLMRYNAIRDALR